MALSTEATIALFALFIACVPGIWFIVNQKNQIRQWWNRNQDHLSGTSSIHFHPCMAMCTEHHWEPVDHSQPDSSQDHNLFRFQSAWPVIRPRPDPPHAANLLEQVFSALQPRYDISNPGVSPTALETGLLIFARVRCPVRNGTHFNCWLIFGRLSTRPILKKMSLWLIQTLKILDMMHMRVFGAFVRKW
jgi:hypothetical protein